MSNYARTIGLALLIGALPLSIRYIWEETWLTWHDGPQMIGFTVVHVLPLLLIWGFLTWIGLAIWTIFAIIRCFYLRSAILKDLSLITASIVLFGMVSIPQQSLSSATESVLGLSPQASSLLVEAARQGQLLRVSDLLNKGAVADFADRGGCSALAAAAGSGNSEVVKTLLEHQANPNGKCGGTPALMKAVEKGDLASTKLLISAGADASIHDQDGFNAYDDALFAKNKELIKYLQSIGAQ